MPAVKLKDFPKFSKFDFKFVTEEVAANPSDLDTGDKQPKKNPAKPAAADPGVIHQKPTIVLLVGAKCGSEEHHPTVLYNAPFIKKTKGGTILLHEVVYDKKLRFVRDNNIQQTEGLFAVDAYGNVLKSLPSGATSEEFENLIRVAEGGSAARRQELDKLLREAGECEADGETAKALSRYAKIARMKLVGWPQIAEAAKKAEELKAEKPAKDL